MPEPADLATPASIVTPPEKPKRTRKPRAAKVPTPPAPKRERRPANTLLARVRAMGPEYVEAYRILAKSDPAFADGLRAEYDATATNERIEARVARLSAELDAAKKAREELPALSCFSRDRLETLAASIRSATTPPADAKPE